ncbi:hypothetical protein GCM10022393_05040 [Aquimarina addita]|uniref:DUF4249 family protein n=2 Tax=Aquimarina addita TaxID=870485 RepID=A0ABP7XB29_9FLAO
MVSCQNEPFELLTEKIDVDSPLFSDLKAITNSKSKESEVVCLTFVYPFNVYLYDDNDQITDSVIVYNDQEFIILLSEMNKEDAVGLSYPISGETIHGEVININNNLELKEAIEACIEEQLIGYCIHLLEEKNCIWKIESLTEDMQYATSVIDFYIDGTGILFTPGDAFRISWIPLYIEQQLYINIRVEGDSEVAEDWNFNWQATILSETSIQIEHLEQNYIITKECDIENDCDYLEFTACHTPESENTSNFIFEEYTDCILSFQEYNDNTETQVSFYTTLQDAMQQINMLSKVGYTNTKNPEIIFVNIANTDEQNDQIIKIVLHAIICD